MSTAKEKYFFKSSFVSFIFLKKIIYLLYIDMDLG